MVERLLSARWRSPVLKGSFATWVSVVANLPPFFVEKPALTLTTTTFIAANATNRVPKEPSVFWASASALWGSDFAMEIAHTPTPTTYIAEVATNPAPPDRFAAVAYANQTVRKALQTCATAAASTSKSAALTVESATHLVKEPAHASTELVPVQWEAPPAMGHAWTLKATTNTVEDVERRAPVVRFVRRVDVNPNALPPTPTFALVAASPPNKTTFIVVPVESNAWAASDASTDNASAQEDRWTARASV